MAWTCTAGSESDLRQAAAKIFAQLKTLWIPKDKGGGGFSNFWQLGHSFDTIIDYFAFIDGAEAASLAPIVLEAYGRSVDTSGCWYDDFGWWGIAAVKATQHDRLFPDSAPFEKIRDACWTTMHTRATAVWENNKNDPSLAPLQPRFEGGVWNAGWTGKSECGQANSPPRLPSDCGNTSQGENLAGIQNTVTNGLYLVLALRLYEATDNSDYREAADRAYKFLTQWFDLQDGEISLLKRLHEPVPGEEDDVLVRERVATYADGSRVCGYEPEISWSGDQGIAIGGLVDRMIVEPGDNNPDSTAFERATGILKGVGILTRERDGGVLQPWISGEGGDPDDYATGPGVFMRYLLYADQENENLRTVTRGPGYREIIDANVREVLNRPLTADLVRLTNGLAILVAAIVMSEN